MNEYGGYFELELNRGDHYHQESVKLNYGRNALELILVEGGFNKVYLPIFTCDVILEPIRKLGIKYSFYRINQHLEPIFDFSDLQENEAFLVNNYFGLKRKYVVDLGREVNNIIIDNAQDFFIKLPNSCWSFNSARKFFGVPDGAYLTGCTKVKIDIPRQESTDKIMPLILRIEKGAKKGYACFQQKEEIISTDKIKLMSTISERILQNVNYQDVITIRNKNFEYLHSKLNKLNNLSIQIESDFVPFTYPFFVSSGKSLRKKLIEKEIYTPIYWPNVFKWCEEGDFEFELAENIVHLPIDQRYNLNDMKKIYNYVSIFINE